MKKEYGPYVEDEDEIKIILPAWKIPEGSTVTKPTGQKEYTLVDEIKLYGEGELEVKKSENTRMLLSNNCINLVSDEQELGWVTSFCELFEILYEDR